MNIKKGDLVMVVKPTLCCNSSSGIGLIFTVASTGYGWGKCAYCSEESKRAIAFLPDGSCGTLSRLKKIDPPANGDSLPTRKDLEVPA